MAGNDCNNLHGFPLLAENTENDLVTIPESVKNYSDYCSLASENPNDPRLTKYLFSVDAKLQRQVNCNSTEVTALQGEIQELKLPSSKSKLYIDTINGDDNNDGGSESTPFKTLNAAKLIEKIQETEQNLAAELELYAVGDIADGLISFEQRVILKKVNTGTITIKSDSKQGLSVFSDLKIEDSFNWENGESGALVGNGSRPFLKINEGASVLIEADQNFFGNNGNPISCEGSLNIKNSTINLYEQSSGADQLESFFLMKSGRFLNEGVKFEQKTDINLTGAVFFCGEYSFLENRSSSANGTTDYTQSTFTISNVGIFADNSRVNKGGVTFNPTAVVNDEQEQVGSLIR